MEIIKQYLLAKVEVGEEYFVVVDDVNDEDKRVVGYVREKNSNNSIVLKICVETNLYISIDNPRLYSLKGNGWKDGSWKYVKPEGYRYEKFPLKGKNIVNCTTCNGSINLCNELKDLERYKRQREC